MTAYLTKDPYWGTIHLWNNKPEFNRLTKCWFAWKDGKEGEDNEIPIDVTNNDLLRNSVTFENSPLAFELHYCN